MTDPVQAIDPVQYRSHTSPRPTAMPADYTQRRVRKRNNECESEKRLVKRQWLGIALTVCGARGTLAVHAVASTARGRTTASPSLDYIYHFFQPFAFTGLYQSVRLHGTISDHFFFGPGLERKLTNWTDFLYAPSRMGDIFRSLFIYRRASAYC